MSPALVILTSIYAVRCALLAFVVIVAVTTSDAGRRRTALALARILAPLSSLPEVLKKR